MHHKIQFGSKSIAFYLEYRDRKTLGIKVHPDMRVQVLAPIDAVEKDIYLKVKTKAPWIIKQVELFRSYLPKTPIRKYVSGETHLYLGRQYKLKIVSENISTVKAYRGMLWVQANNPTSLIVENMLQQWYKERADIIFNEVLEDVLPLFKRYNIGKPKLFIRAMAKRWGSCTPAGKIILNTELIKAPKGSIEYVVIHELCHLVHYNHTKQFFDLQNKLMPDWKKWKDRLEYSLA